MTTNPRLLRSRVLPAAAVAACVGALVPAGAAQAETRSGDVTVTIPARIVIDGSPIAVSVDSTSLYSSLDRVYVSLYTGDQFQTSEEIHPDTTTQLPASDLAPGSVVGKADLATTECDTSSTDPCFFESSDDYYYEFVNGLTYHDSTAAVAKYASKVTLVAVAKKTAVVWTATVTHYETDGWVPFKNADVTIGSQHVTSDRRGVATWTERTTARHRFTASVAETGTVWSSTSASVRASAPIPAKPVHLTSSSSAAAVGRAMEARIVTLDKVKALTRKSDSNKLLGRANGYSSAAVLYDSRVTCSDGPGADCGATIERWPSEAKAKARSKYILTILKSAPILGSEHHAIEGRFLLRVTGDLTAKQAKAYVKAFRALL